MDNVCTMCGAAFIAEGCGTGYGYNAKKDKICYACCGELDKATMREGKPITLYLTLEKGGAYNPANLLGPSGHTGEVTNWPGSLRLKAFTTPRRHNFTRHARNVWAWFEGRQWYGVQADSGGQLVTMRPLKIKTNKKG